MTLHCICCNARVFLFDHGVVHRPDCPDCGAPLPMPCDSAGNTPGPMSPYPEKRRRRSAPRPAGRM